MTTHRGKSVLQIHNNKIKSLFELLGYDENSLSYSLGYTLYNCPTLLKSIVNKIYDKNVKFNLAEIKLQNFGEKDRGYTDFEVELDDKYFFVIEAKRGLNLPDPAQLKKYRNRFYRHRKRYRFIVVLTECSDDFVSNKLPKSIYNVKIKPLSWLEVIKSINASYPFVGNKEKFILDELRKYLEMVVTMKNVESNKVYVVSLAQRMNILTGITPRELAHERRRYFYPSSGGWPVPPPNYIAFRFGGKLQFIQHVERYELVDDVHKEIPEVKKGKCKDYYLLFLGEPFEPRKELRNGKIWSNGRLWCMLDTLFTARSIKEASEITKKREAITQKED